LSVRRGKEQCVVWRYPSRRQVFCRPPSKSYVPSAPFRIRGSQDELLVPFLSSEDSQTEPWFDRRGMDNSKREFQTTKFILFITVAVLTITALLTVQLKQVEGSSPSPAATYSHGSLHLTIPYQASSAGTGRLIVEVLDPNDHVLGHAEQQLSVSTGPGRWKDEINCGAFVSPSQLAC